MTYTSHDVQGFDYVHHYVGNARHTAFFYAAQYGFDIVGYQGPETGVKDQVSYMLNQNDLTFIVTAPLDPNHPKQKFIRTHGDGVGEITLKVPSPAAAVDFASRNGAEVLDPVKTVTDEHGSFISGSIAIYGGVKLTFINREDYNEILIPGYNHYEGPQFKIRQPGLQYVDHIVGNVGEGEMDKWAAFFEDCLDFETYIHFDKGDISTQYSSLVSKVVRSKNSAVKFPINEPAEGIKKSQIEEFLDEYHGAGVQHVAIATNDILGTIQNLTDRGVQFIPIPQTYYDVVADRVAIMKEDLETVKRLNILIDREGDGYLLQLFTQPINDRPTLFFEFIQRHGSEGFGQNNFQSLFESIEQEQAKRGNL